MNDPKENEALYDSDAVPLSSSQGGLQQTAAGKAAEATASKGGVYHGRSAAVDAVTGYKKDMEVAVATAGRQGTVLGVIFPCMANILGVLLFLRLPFIVGVAGIWQALLVVAICCLTTFITALSLSAVSTNGKILGGGSYFLISRSLGPSLGAGVGLCFYCANSLGAALYITGTVEAWLIASTKPGEDNPWGAIYPFSGKEEDRSMETQMNTRLIGWIILAACLGACLLGIKYIARLGTLFLFIVLIVIITMYVGLFVGPHESVAENALVPINLPGGGTADYRWEHTTTKYMKDNWNPKYKVKTFAFPADKTEWNFAEFLGLWFPACTGIMAGSNRSADLATPSRSIPIGTLTAQIITSIMYLSFTFLYGWACSTEMLLHNGFIAADTAWPRKEIVIYGVMASTIGAALQSLTSASRLLNAIAQDHTLPFLDYVRAEPGKEPWKALLLSGLLCFIAIAPGDLNAIGPILTQFFLMCYFCINMSCAILDLMNDPNWRPTFRYHHVLVSLSGMILCLILMFIIKWYFALIAMFICAVVFYYATTNSHEINWGDGFRGMKFQLAKALLRDVEVGPTHTKNWRPQILVLTGVTIDPDKEGIQLHDIELIHLASQLKAGKGLTIVGGVIHVPDLGRGSFLSRLSASTIKDWSNVVHCNMQELGIAGFAKCVYAPQLGEGILSLIQTAGLGAFQPNCVMVSWPFSWVVVPDARVRFIQTVQVCSVFEKVIIVAKEGHSFPLNGAKIRKGTIDIWWVVADGGIMLLLAFLLNQNEVWKGSQIRLFAIIDQQNDDAAEVKEELVNYIKDHRLPISVRTVGMPSNVVFAQSRFGDLNRRMQTRQSRFASVTGSKKDNPFDDIFRNAERVRGTSSRYRNDSVLARNAFTDPGPNFKPGTRGVQDINFDPDAEAGPDANNPAKPEADAESLGGVSSPASVGSQRQSIGASRNNNWVSSFVMTDQRLKSNTPCTEKTLECAKKLNEAIKKQSGNASMVITNLPDVPEEESAFGYMQFIEHLTAELPRTLLIRGTAGEMITAFT